MLLDKFDTHILAVLQADGRIQNKDLAERIGLSASPCLRRVRLLEEVGVIERYVAIVAPDKIGFTLNIFVNVKLKSQDHASVSSFETEIKKYDNIMECYFMTGSTDYIMRIVARDIAEYEHFLMTRLTKIECISKVESFLSMRKVKHSTMLPTK